MKIGTLVTLSSYGMKRQNNFNVTYQQKNPIGMITKIKDNHFYPYVVHWVNVNGRVSSPYFDAHYHRRELKYAKTKSG